LRKQGDERRRRGKRKNSEKKHPPSNWQKRLALEVYLHTGYILQ
jgi:hypothetical protein